MNLLKFWFPVWAYSAIIFYLSSRPGSDVQIPWQIGDKVAHLIEYAILGFLVLWAYLKTRSEKQMILWLWAILWCMLFGLSDEWHQSFVPGREVSILDWIADAIGSMLGASFCLVINQNRKKVIDHGSH